MHKKILVALLLGLVGGTAVAGDYYVVVPLPGKPKVAPAITVNLKAYSLPDGVAGQIYPTFDFGTLLHVTGDANYSAGSATFSATGLPSGLSLSPSGLLLGTPAAPGTSVINVQAQYKDKSGANSYTLAVAAMDLALQAGGYRTWRDGTLATSCNGYRNPAAGKTYTGDKGDGAYRIQPDGQPALDVYQVARKAPPFRAVMDSAAVM